MFQLTLQMRELRSRGLSDLSPSPPPGKVEAKLRAFSDFYYPFILGGYVAGVLLSTTNKWKCIRQMSLACSVQSMD